MKARDDFEILRAIIENIDGKIVATYELLHKAELQEMPFEFADLIGYWKKGQLYASQVERTNNGYVPTANCLWTTQYQRGFFGFNTRLASFEINSNTTNPINATLEASLSLDGAATCVAVHPAGKEFAVGMRTGTISICNVDQGRVIRTFNANHDRVWALAFSPVENIFLSGHENGELIKWDLDGNLIKKIATDDWIRSIDFSQDGKRFLTSRRVEQNLVPSIYNWDAESLQVIEKFVHVSKTVSCIRYFLDGKGFVSGSSDYKITAWSFEKNDVLWSEKKHTGAIIVLAAHPFGGIVASGAWTGTVKLWDLETGVDLRSIEAHSGRVNGLAISPSGRILATGGKEASICLWQLPECSIITRFNAHDGWLRGLQFINENTLISIGSEGMCKIWRLERSIAIAPSSRPYNSAQEVLDEFRRSLGSDDE